MADVVITLSLSRRSGILAAAVSAVSRAGLHFGTHRFEDAGHGPRLHLNAESDGEFADFDPVVAELSAIRGIDEVMDVLVDGRSLLYPEEPLSAEPPEELTAADGVPEAGSEAVVEAGPMAGFQEKTVEQDEPVQPAALADSGPEPEPDPEPGHSMEAESVPEALSEDVVWPPDAASGPSAQPAAPPEPDEDDMMRRLMVRRRRRRR